MIKVMNYRIDKKYQKVQSNIIDFFSNYLKEPLRENNKVKLNYLDFVVYKNDILIVGAEIKSYKETQSSASSWYNYHTKITKRIRPETIHLNIGNLPVLVKGFIATIDGQMRGYAEKNNLYSIWLIQEGKEFFESLEVALQFLIQKSRIYGAKVFFDKNLLFSKIDFVF